MHVQRVGPALLVVNNGSTVKTPNGRPSNPTWLLMPATAPSASRPQAFRTQGGRPRAYVIADARSRDRAGLDVGCARQRSRSGRSCGFDCFTFAYFDLCYEGTADETEIQWQRGAGLKTARIIIFFFLSVCGQSVKLCPLDHGTSCFFRRSWCRR